MTTWVPLLAAITAAAAALLGYWLTSRSKQLDAKAEAYADALSAIEAYKSLPYRIRRSTNDPGDLAALQRLIGDVEQEIAFYRRWLALESATVGLAFEALANKVMKLGGKHRGDAWNKPKPPNFPFEADRTAYEYHDQFEQRVCLAAMRWDLGRRRRTARNGLSQPSSAARPGQSSHAQSSYRQGVDT